MYLDASENLLGPMRCPNIAGWTGSGNRGWKCLLEDTQSCPWILAFSDGRNVAFQLASADMVWCGSQERVKGLTASGWGVTAWKDVYIELEGHRLLSKGRWKTSSLFIHIIYPIIMLLSNKKWKFFRPCSSGFWASPLDKLGSTYIIFFNYF